MSSKKSPMNFRRQIIRKDVLLKKRSAKFMCLFLPGESHLYFHHFVYRKSVFSWTEMKFKKMQTPCSLSEPDNQNDEVHP